MSQVQLKPRKQLEEALAKIDKESEFDKLYDAHLELSCDSRLRSLVMFLKNHFYPDETLCKSVDLDFDDEVTNLFLDVLKDNLSVLLISNSTNEIIACRTMAIRKRDDDPDLSKISNRKWAVIMTFLKHKYKDMDVFKYYNVDTAISFIALATHRDYRARGIASKLMKATLAFCKELGLNPVCVKGEGTSHYSQRIYEKFGFETIHSLKYDDYKIDGEVVFKNTGDVKTTECYVKKL